MSSGMERIYKARAEKAERERDEWKAKRTEDRRIEALHEARITELEAELEVALGADSL